MKEPIILLHGALGSKKQLLPLKEILTDHFEVHALNFEGHGGESTDKEFSIELFSENLLGFIEERQLKSVIIFGHSMGGYVALKAALKAPDKIKKIITLGTKFDWTLETAIKEVRQLDPGLIKEKVPHFAEKLRQEHHPAKWEEIMQKTAGLMLGLAKGAKLTDQELQSIQTEVSIGIGSLDKMVSYEESAQVVGLLPNAKLAPLEGVKHPIEQVDPALLKSFILNTLQ